MHLINDKFRKARGGRSKFLDLSCENCGKHLYLYQKDGPGPLKRLYTDRIISSKVLWSNNKKLLCGKCSRWLGIASVYKKETRKCFILFAGVIKKKVWQDAKHQ